MTSSAIEARAPHGHWLAADTSAALVHAAQRGTARELDTLLRTMRPMLFAYFARRVDAASADDLAQQALLIIAREYQRVEPAGASRWLVTVARNIARDEFRRASRAAVRRAPVGHARAVPGASAASTDLEYAELAQAIVAAAGRACTASLRVVVFGLLRGLDVPELARELGITEAAVRVRLTRARLLLRRELGRFW